jgi:hypothetical protein
MRDRLQPFHLADGIGDDVLDRRLVVGQPVDEGRVGPVLQQPAHQVGQQVLVAAHRRIDATRPVELVGPEHFPIERLAHAVQPLELVVLRLARHHRDGGQRMGVVGGELGIEHVAPRQHQFGAGEIGHVRADLAGEHRKAREPRFLGPLDLGVPIRPLDQPHRQLAARHGGEFGQPLEHRIAALGIALDGEPQPVPAGEVRRCGGRREDLQLQVEPVGLLGIDGEAEIGGFRGPCQFDEPRHQLVHQPALGLGLVARMDGRQLDRQRRPREDARARVQLAGLVRHHLQRLHVGGKVAVGVGHGHRRFAQHVEGEPVALGAHRLGDVQRLLDGAAEHKMLAHDAHGPAHGAAHHRLAGAPGELPEVARDVLARLRAQLDEAPGEHQPPGGRVDEQRVRMANVAVPLAPADLVGDQLVGGGGVGDAQERFRQAHEHHALLARQGVFLHELVDAAGLAPPAPHRLHQVAGPRLGLARLGRRNPRPLDQFKHHGRLIGQQVFGDSVPAGKFRTGLVDLLSKRHRRPPGEDISI